MNSKGGRDNRVLGSLFHLEPGPQPYDYINVTCQYSHWKVSQIVFNMLYDHYPPTRAFIEDVKALIVDKVEKPNDRRRGLVRIHFRYPVSTGTYDYELWDLAEPGCTKMPRGSVTTASTR